VKRIQRRDRPWPDLDVTVVCGPFAMPTADDLRHAVAALAQRYPHSRLTWGFDPTKQFWTDRSPETVVVERDWDNATDVGARLDAIALDGAISPPLTFVRYPDHIGMKVSHSVGDGRVFQSVLATVLQTAITGDVVAWPAKRGGRFPLTAAAFRTFGRRPGLIRAAINDRHDHGDPPTNPTPSRPWSPSRRTLHHDMPRDRADEIFDWGKQFAPNASRFAIQVSLMLRALSRVGIDISADVRVVVDLRRYLGWRYIDGNFIAATSMDIDAGQGPEEISSTIRATNGSARPLIAQMAAQTQGALFSCVDAGEPTEVDPGVLPSVTFSSLGLSPEIDSLPFVPDAPVVFAGSVPADGPSGLTFLFIETSKVMTVTAIFHDNVIDADLLDQAMRTAMSDPLGLLAGVPKSG
jgi:hypothetical protein